MGLDDVIGVTLADIRDARRRLEGVVRPTPARLADALCRALGRHVVIKPEHIQRAGSFKIRGAYNRVSRLPKGIDVIAASAGNHAQGVALASALTGHRATIFMPEAASLPKVKATEDYGASVELTGATLEEAMGAATIRAGETGAVFVPPFNDPLVIAGQATVGLELAEELEAVDWNGGYPLIGEAPSEPPVVLVPIGGGGLIAGVALALAHVRPDIRVIGVEAAGAASMRRSLDTGRITKLPSVATMADGIALKAPGELTFAVVRELVEDVVTVTEEEISQAVLMLLERAKAVVEPSGAVGIAALMSGKVTGTAPAVAILSGGNVDPLLLSHIVQHGLSAAGRFQRLRIVDADRPGSLAAITAAVARQGVNVLDVEHHREGVTVGVSEVEILLTVETRDAAHGAAVIAALGGEGFRVTPA